MEFLLRVLGTRVLRCGLRGHEFFHESECGECGFSDADGASY